MAREADEQEIRTLIQRLKDAGNVADEESFAALFAHDAGFAVFNGKRLSGRNVFATGNMDPTARLALERLQFLGDDAAVACLDVLVTMTYPTLLAPPERPAGPMATEAQLEILDALARAATAGDPVLLYGWPQTWQAWHRGITRLAGRHAVVVPDLPGLGDSEGPAAGYDTATLAEDVHDLLRRLGLLPAHLVGHDLGVPVTYALVKGVQRRRADVDAAGVPAARTGRATRGDPRHRRAALALRLGDLTNHASLLAACRYVLDVAMEMTVDGAKVEACPGQSVRIPRGLVHSFIVTSDVGHVLNGYTSGGSEHVIKGLAAPAGSHEPPPLDFPRSDDRMIERIFNNSWCAPAEIAWARVPLGEH